MSIVVNVWFSASIIRFLNRSAHKGSSQSKIDHACKNEQKVEDEKDGREKELKI